MPSRKHCSVPCCGETVGPMYRFPKDSTLRERWRSECRVTRIVSDYMLVCHRHFRADDVDLNCRHKRLQKRAVPMLNLPDMVSQKGRRNCIIHTCQNGDRQDVTLHFFPKSVALQLQWASACKVTGKVSRNTRICSSHFSDDDFISGVHGFKMLKSRVLPSHNLPLAYPSSSASHKSKRWSVLSTQWETEEAFDGIDEHNPFESEDTWIQRFINK